MRLLPEKRTLKLPVTLPGSNVIPVTVGWAARDPAHHGSQGRLKPAVTPDQARAILQTVFTNFRRERAAAARADAPRDHIERLINTPVYLRSAANGPSGLRQNFERPLWALGLIAVSPRFLETMRIRLLDGRDFEWRDGQPESPSAVIVNESFARRYFPGESPLGKRFFQVWKREHPDRTRHRRHRRRREVRQRSRRNAADCLRASAGRQGWASVQVRTHLEPGALAALLRNELPRVHPAFRMTGVTLQSTLVDNTLVRERVLALLSGFFSIVAIVLVAVGLYGVLSYGVVQRTREIGIRLALGAQPLGVVRLVVSEVCLVTALGLGVDSRGLSPTLFSCSFPPPPLTRFHVYRFFSFISISGSHRAISLTPDPV